MRRQELDAQADRIEMVHGLTVVGQVVQTTTVDAASLQTVIQGLAQTIHETKPMLDSLSSLTSKDFPDAVDATQTSLASAQSSALLIDNVIYGMRFV